MRTSKWATERTMETVFGQKRQYAEVKEQEKNERSMTTAFLKTMMDGVPTEFGNGNKKKK